MTCIKWLLVAGSMMVGFCHSSWSAAAKEMTRTRTVVRAPAVALLSERTINDSAQAPTARTPDRSPILRSFNPQLKPIDPYAIPVTINRRSALKW